LIYKVEVSTDNNYKHKKKKPESIFFKTKG